MKLTLNGAEFEAHLPTVITSPIYTVARRVLRRFEKRVSEHRKSFPVFADATSVMDGDEARKIFKARSAEVLEATEAVSEFDEEQEVERVYSLAQALIVRGSGHLTPEQVAAIDTDVLGGPFWPHQDFAAVAEEVRSFRDRIR